MNCIEAREAMLDAEPAELRGESESPLAAHVRDCPTCHALARALARDTAVLSSRVRVRSRRRTLSITLLPVAAALVATVTVRANRGDQPSVAVRSHADAPAKIVSVDVGVGQQATVIKTADPKTTLVWISSGSH
jgi:hypothetical protein